jgi:hypothetical protein
MKRRHFLSGSLVAGTVFEHFPLAAYLRGERSPTGDLQSGVPPAAKLGPLRVSRLICGGNLFSGFAHSGELTYLSRLLKEYFTDSKILDTLQLAESAGINTAILRTDDHIIGLLNRYRKERGGRMQWIAQTYPREDNLEENIQRAIDNGAVGAFVMGGIADRWVAAGKAELLGGAVEFIRRNGLVAGIGAHSLEVLRATAELRIPVDFLFKTINSVGYETQHPATVASFMRTINKPWVAFKVLGAGRMKPADGFRLAFHSGADFINVGMYDFQIKEDIAFVRDAVAQTATRDRPWIT